MENIWKTKWGICYNRGNFKVLIPVPLCYSFLLTSFFRNVISGKHFFFFLNQNTANIFSSLLLSSSSLHLSIYLFLALSKHNMVLYTLLWNVTPGHRSIQSAMSLRKRNKCVPASLYKQATIMSFRNAMATCNDANTNIHSDFFEGAHFLSEMFPISFSSTTFIHI